MADPSAPLSVRAVPQTKHLHCWNGRSSSTFIRWSARAEGLSTSMRPLEVLDLCQIRRWQGSLYVPRDSISTRYVLSRSASRNRRIAVPFCAKWMHCQPPFLVLGSMAKNEIRSTKIASHAVSDCLMRISTKYVKQSLISAGNMHSKLSYRPNPIAFSEYVVIQY